MPLNSYVKISVQAKHQAIDFESKIVRTTVVKGRRIAFIEPLMVNGKTVNLARKYADVEIIPPGISRPFKFRAEGIRFARGKKASYHYLEYKHHLKLINRRGYYRVPFVQPATIQLSTHTSTVPAYIHDMSISGISVTIKSDQMDAKGVEIGSKINISFTLGENPRVYVNRATVVRYDQNARADVTDEESKTSKYTILGCTFDETDPGILALVTMMMRREAGTKTTK